MTENEREQLRVIRDKVRDVRVSIYDVTKNIESARVTLDEIEEMLLALLAPVERREPVAREMQQEPAEDPCRVNRDYLVAYSARTHNWLVTSMGEVVANADSFAEANAIAQSLRNQLGEPSKFKQEELPMDD